MRLFLASAALTFPSRGESPAHHLRRLVADATATAIILNAADEQPDPPRSDRLTDERRGLGALGTHAFELDLRGYAGRGDALRHRLAGVGLVWVAGGDMNTLRPAIARSGLDAILAERLGDESIAYGGHSAGACVAGPPITERDLTHAPFAAADPLWGAMGLVDFTIVPHWQAGGPEDDGFAQVVAHLRGAGLRYCALRNGQALVIDGTAIALVD